ncbi:hypothetical protein [Marispirochaeta sp.]|uniref:GTP pyrophosphokinase n=1 Tax=Marispirochaeta sp. TaxID=2038653 RepID=UPI0029C6D5B5|nr:hypothetical protein [Marispirochaeta sp.]
MTKKQIVQGYKRKYKAIEIATRKLTELTTTIISSESIQTHAILGRTKSIDSYAKKVERYDRLEDNITDYIGLRIITYVQSDADKVCNIIEKEFSIDEKNCINKNNDLGADKIGYRSIHYIAKLKEDRTELVEYKDMKEYCFEIQVRTLLQHAWAEIEHDRKYKFSGVLPLSIQRRLNLVSAVLEVADNEFNAIAQEFDVYYNSIESDIRNKKYDAEINSTTLFEYIKQNYQKYFKNSNWVKLFQENNEEMINELIDYGVHTINELTQLEKVDYFNKIIYSNHEQTFIGILRDLMIINDYKRYFKKAWKNHWDGIDDETENIYVDFGIPVKELYSKYKLSHLNDDEFEEDEFDENDLPF